MVELSELLTKTRFPPGWRFALMILYFPIGVFLIVCRVLIALHTYMIVCLLPRAAARRQLVRAMLGVLGVHIWVDEDKTTTNDKPKVLVSNYTSILDHVVIDVVISHIVPYHGNVLAIFQWVLGYKDLDSSQGREQFQQNIKTFVDDTDLPVLIQPEDVPTNNTVGLLKFNTLAFELEVPIQPVSVQMSRLSFPCALTTIDSPKWTDVLWCFYTPVTVFRVKTHPVLKRGEEESVVEFSERVRGVIGDALNLEKTEFTAGDVSEYIKKIKVPPAPQRSMQAKPTAVSGPAARQNTGSCFDSVDAELKRMIQQVKDVLPQVPVQAVKQDLEQTKDVDTTITNILEGRVAFHSFEEEVNALKKESPVTVDKDTTLFKASSFSRNPDDRHLSLEDRKKQMLETARYRYRQKHGLL